MNDIESIYITDQNKAEYFYNLLLELTEEDINEVEIIIQAVAEIHCRICDYTSWTVYTKPVTDNE